jgi:2-succinyl-6-hydroxy-2,4-cyclohexadiene-1-carboxylate synthase
VPTPVVFIHGFAGSARHWDRVIAKLPAGAFTPIALNVSEAEPLTPEGVTSLVSASTPGRFVLVGYSMGGRLALHTALAIPERVARLVLLSASAGIADDLERAARAAADEALASEIERAPIAQFIERWRSVPLFADDPDWLADEVAMDQSRCTPAQLAASLRGLGPGAMAPMWTSLGELRMPVAVLAGADDRAYVESGRRLAAEIPNATFSALAGAGHRLALQAPEAVARAI